MFEIPAGFYDVIPNAAWILTGHAKRRHRFMIGSVELQPPFCGAAPVPSTSAAALATTGEASNLMAHNAWHQFLNITLSMSMAC